MWIILISNSVSYSYVILHITILVTNTQIELSKISQIKKYNEYISNTILVHCSSILSNIHIVYLVTSPINEYQLL